MQTLLRADIAGYKVAIAAAVAAAAAAGGLAVASVGLLSDQRWQVLLVGGLLLGGLVLASGRPVILTVFLFVFSMTTQVGMNIPRGPVWHHGGAASVFQLFVYDVVFVPLVGMWALRRFRGEERSARLDLVDLAPLAFIVWSAMTISVAVLPSYSLFQMYLMAKVYFFYLFMRSWVDRWRSVEVATLALATGTILQSVIIFAQFVLQKQIGIMGEMADRPLWLGGQFFNRPGGTIGSDQGVASYLAFLVPLCLAGLLVTKTTWQRMLYATACSVSTAALAMTLSRAGWIQFATALLAFGIILSRRITFRMLCLALATLGAAGLGLARFTDLADLIQMRVLDAPEISTFGRLDMAVVAWNMIQANPILGVGLNTFRFVAPHYDPTGITLVTPVAVHNIPLLVWAETGTVGLLLFFAFPTLVCWRLWRCARRALGAQPVVAGAILAALVGFFAGSLLDVNYAHQLNIVHFWVVAGLGMAVTRLEPDKQALLSSAPGHSMQTVQIGHGCADA